MEKEGFREQKYRGEGKSINKFVAPGEASLTMKDNYISLNGMIGLSVPRDCAKYIEHLQIQLFTKEAPTVKLRINNQEYNRIEIYMDIQHINKLIKHLQDIKEYLGVE